MIHEPSLGSLHSLGRVDSQKIQAGLKNASSHIAQNKSCGAALGRFSLQHRTRFVKGMKNDGQIVEIIGEKIWAKILKNERDHLAKLEELDAQRTFFRRRKPQLLRHCEFAF